MPVSGDESPEELAERLERMMLERATRTDGPFVARVTDAAPGQSLGIVSIANLRDLGGYTTQSGLVVRKGLLYRSNQLRRISIDDMKRIAALGLKRSYDLRTAAERVARPDELPPGVKMVWLDVLADADLGVVARIERLLRNPMEANVEFGAGKAEAMFIQGYREFVSLPSARKAYRLLFVALASDENLPALFHCTTGKDRTGWASAVLLSLLGVSEDLILEDFLRSNEYILPAYRKTIDTFTGAGGDSAITEAIFVVKAEYLSAAFNEMHRRYGTVEDYFSKALEIDSTGQQALRDRLLADDATSAW